MADTQNKYDSDSNMGNHKSCKAEVEVMALTTAETGTQPSVVILLVFRKPPYSDLLDFLVASVPTSTFPCNFFLWNYPILIRTFQYLYTITDLSFPYFLVITHSPPNETAYLASTSHIPYSDLNMLTTSEANEHRI